MKYLLSYAYKSCREYTTIFLSVEKILAKYVDNNFIIKYILYGRVTWRIVLSRSTKSMFFNVTLNNLIHIWLGTQKSNTDLNSFYDEH